MTRDYKKVINGKVYDRFTATDLVSYTTGKGKGNWTECLFRKKTGEYFLYIFNAYVAPNDRITFKPITLSEAREWFLTHAKLHAEHHAKHQHEKEEFRIRDPYWKWDVSTWEEFSKRFKDLVPESAVLATGEDGVCEVLAWPKPELVKAAEEHAINFALSYCDLCYVVDHSQNVDHLGDILPEDISDDCPDEEKKEFEKLLALKQGDFEKLAVIYEEKHSRDTDPYRLWVQVIEDYIAA